MLIKSFHSHKKQMGAKKNPVPTFMDKLNNKN